MAKHLFKDESEIDVTQCDMICIVSAMCMLSPLMDSEVVQKTYSK